MSEEIYILVFYTQAIIGLSGLLAIVFAPWVAFAFVILQAAFALTFALEARK